MPQTTKNLAILRVMGITLFVMGLASAYFHWPMDHPWQFDLAGAIISIFLILSPGSLIEMGNALVSKFTEAKNGK